MEIFSFFLEWSWLDRIYLLFAIVGGMIFLLRLALGAIFGGSDGDVDADGTVHHSSLDADASLRLLTIEGITAFALMFGLVGLAMRRSSGSSEIASLIAAMFAGCLMAVLLAKIGQWMRRLQSSGTLDINNAVGTRGTIYLTIPGAGTGQAQIKVQNRLRIFDARSQDHEPIRTGEMVEVTEVVNGNLLIVKKL